MKTSVRIVSQVVFVIAALGVVRASDPEPCETLPSEIHIIKGIKHIFVQTGENKCVPQAATAKLSPNKCVPQAVTAKLSPKTRIVNEEEFDDLGRLQRTCNGDVGVNKCEGQCNSQVQPSVITPTGFLKECYCCRESFLRERVVTLTHCYDPDGGRLNTDGQGTLDIKLKEPAECKCYKCGEFSR